MRKVEMQYGGQVHCLMKSFGKLSASDEYHFPIASHQWWSTNCIVCYEIEEKQVAIAKNLNFCQQLFNAHARVVSFINHEFTALHLNNWKVQVIADTRSYINNISC